MAPDMPPMAPPSSDCGGDGRSGEGPLQKEVRQMTDRDKNSGSSNVNQGGMSGSSGRSGSQGDQQSGQSGSSGRQGESGSSSQGGIRDNASPGEGSIRSSSEGFRDPSGSDELSGDESRTGQSGQSGRSG